MKKILGIMVGVGLASAVAWWIGRTDNGPVEPPVEEQSIPATNDLKLEFKYDYDGRRYYKKVSKYGSGGWSVQDAFTYVWNGNNIIHQSASETPAMAFVWGLEGKVLAVHTAQGTYFYGHDANKNVTDLADASSLALVDRYRYDAFGNETATHPSGIGNLNPFRFSNEYRDAETGLYAYKYRYYSTPLGRFLNRDPIEEQGGFNLYGFVGNRPVDRIDLLGLTNDIGDFGYAIYNPKFQASEDRNNFDISVPEVGYGVSPNI